MSLVVVWRITEYCDLGCRYCGYSREVRRPRTHVAADTVLAFGAVLRDHARETGRAVLVSWLGGEPLRWPPLADVSRTLAREYGLRLGVTTNGTRLGDERVLALLAECYAQVTISVDGGPGFHDWVRGAPGLFERLRNSLLRLRERKTQTGMGPLIRINTVLMRSNLIGFGGLCEALAGWGVDEVTFNALGGVERGGEFYERERLLPEHLAWLRAELPGLRARLAERGLIIRGAARYLDRLEAAARSHPWPVADCEPGRSFLFIDQHSLVAPCSFTTRGYGAPLAEVRSIAHLPQLMRERQQQQRLPACDDCRSTHVFGKFS